MGKLSKSFHSHFRRLQETTTIVDSPDRVLNMFLAQIRLAAVEMTESRAGILRLIGVSICLILIAVWPGVCEIKQALRVYLWDEKGRLSQAKWSVGGGGTGRSGTHAS